MTALIAKPKSLTADDLLRLHSQGVRGELVRGVLRKTAPGGLERGELTATIGYFLSVFVKPRRLGRVMMGAGVILERGPDTVRRASVSFVSARGRWTSIAPMAQYSRSRSAIRLTAAKPCPASLAP